MTPRSDGRLGTRGRGRNSGNLRRVSILPSSARSFEPRPSNPAARALGPQAMGPQDRS
jgi:hypothetical protein